MKYEDEHYYHIYNRGAHKKEIFFEEENYKFLVRLFEKYLEPYCVTVVAYCLMPNHYHLVVKQNSNSNGDIGNFLKTTFNAYTQAINNRFGLSGTLFQGQAKVKHISSDEYCVHLIRYIHLNPVTAKLIKRAEDWKFSNYLEWIGKRDGMLMDKNLRNGYFTNGDNYKIFVEEYAEIRVKAAIKQFLFDED